MLGVGDLAKDFELPNFENKRVRLFDRLTQGSPLFLVFYKFNCPTCQFTFPHLARIAPQLGNAHFLAVAQDTPAEAKEFRNKYGLTFDVVCDTNPYPVSVAYGIDYVPTGFLIEGDRKISTIMEGFDKKYIEALSQRLAGLKKLSGFTAFDPAQQIPLRRPG